MSKVPPTPEKLKEQLNSLVQAPSGGTTHSFNVDMYLKDVLKKASKEDLKNHLEYYKSHKEDYKVDLPAFLCRRLSLSLRNTNLKKGVFVQSCLDIYPNLIDIVWKTWHGKTPWLVAPPHLSEYLTFIPLPDDVATRNKITDLLQNKNFHKTYNALKNIFQTNIHNEDALLFVLQDAREKWSEEEMFNAFEGALASCSTPLMSNITQQPLRALELMEASFEELTPFQEGSLAMTAILAHYPIKITSPIDNKVRAFHYLRAAHPDLFLPEIKPFKNLLLYGVEEPDKMSVNPSPACSAMFFSLFASGAPDFPEGYKKFAQCFVDDLLSLGLLEKVLIDVSAYNASFKKDTLKKFLPFLSENGKVKMIEGLLKGNSFKIAVKNLAGTMSLDELSKVGLTHVHSDNAQEWFRTYCALRTQKSLSSSLQPTRKESHSRKL